MTSASTNGPSACRLRYLRPVRFNPNWTLFSAPHAPAPNLGFGTFFFLTSFCFLYT